MDAALRHSEFTTTRCRLALSPDTISNSSSAQLRCAESKLALRNFHGADKTRPPKYVAMLVALASGWWQMNGDEEQSSDGLFLLMRQLIHDPRVSSIWIRSDQDRHMFGAGRLLRISQLVLDRCAETCNRSSQRLSTCSQRKLTPPCHLLDAHVPPRSLHVLFQSSCVVLVSATVCPPSILFTATRSSWTWRCIHWNCVCKCLTRPTP